MIDGFLVVAVVAGSRLMAVNLDREAVDVDGGIADATVAVARAFEMPMRPFEQGTPYGLVIGFAGGQPIDEPGLRGLAGHALVENFFARPVPRGHLDRRIMGEPVQVILMDLAQSHGVDSFPQKFDTLVTDAVSSSGVDQLIGE